MSANSDMASAKENPKIANENISFLSDGFLDTPNINAANIIPAAIAPPNTPTVAHPAPINFAAATIYFLLTLMVIIFLFIDKYFIVNE